MELAHGAAGEEEDLAGEVGAAGHTHHEVRVGVTVKLTQRQGVSLIIDMIYHRHGLEWNMVFLDYCLQCSCRIIFFFNKLL